MGIFDKLKEPVFLKENSNALEQLEVLKKLQPKLNSEGQVLIKQDIKNLNYGILGENNIDFELRNSHIPMYVLRDIYIEDGDLGAQIDYLVITRKLCFIIECKNLYGDIEINSNGEFIRTVDYNGRKKKEGIYSPITQNNRHLELIKKIKCERQSNFVMKFMAGKFFESSYKSIVVLANPKTILNVRYTKKDIKDQVIRADQLIAYIKDQCLKSKESNISDADMKAWAESFLKIHIEAEKDYTKKYQSYMADTNLEDEKNLVDNLQENPKESREVKSEDEKNEEENKALETEMPEQDLICPRCGNTLVLRVASKGENKGNQFYGCSIFPKCRYIQNIDDKCSS